jgi:glutathione-specific gamma-glutamylcyclotransferase
MFEGCAAQSGAHGLEGMPIVNSDSVFAYGSLVNSRARPSGVHWEPGILSGWVRQWMHCVETPQGKVCALTVSPYARVEIAGAVLFQSAHGLAELDERESGYRRVRVPVRLERPGPITAEIDCFTYIGDSTHHKHGSDEYPIWRSYLDCVLAGYFEVGGREAMENFIASTQGWDAPILDDRRMPLYPRAVALTSDLERGIDDTLAEHGLLKNLVKLPSSP